MGEKLKAHLGLGTHPDSEMSYHAAQGFLFAVACAPRAVHPADWIPLVLGKRFWSIRGPEASAISDELLVLFSNIATAVVQVTPTLPADCPLDPDPMSNFDERAPVSQWSRGFYAGHRWLKADWDAAVPFGEDPDADAALGRAIPRLGCFASRAAAEALVEASAVSVEEFAGYAHSLFTDAMTAYAFIGLTRRLQREGKLPPARPVPVTAPKLNAYLGLNEKEEGQMSYHSVQGFLFAVACAPRTVGPHEWIALVLGWNFKSLPMNEADAISEELIVLCNSITLPAVAGKPALPRDCVLQTDPMANFDEKAPVAQWSRGFSAGHQWLLDEWVRAVPLGQNPALDIALALAVPRLTCFTSRSEAETLVTMTGARSLEEFAAAAHLHFEESMRAYAKIGVTRKMQREGLLPQPPHLRVGRNDPCPCGSGRKYKKCCLVVH